MSASMMKLRASQTSNVRVAASRRMPVINARLASKTAAKAKNAAQVCLDCGYLYDGKKGAFEDLPGSYSCPACGANKKRFRAFEGNVSRSNDAKTMSSRRDALVEQLEARGESADADPALLIGTAGTAALFLGAAYYFTVLAR